MLYKSQEGEICLTRLTIQKGFQESVFNCKCDIAIVDVEFLEKIGKTFYAQGDFGKNFCMLQIFAG